MRMTWPAALLALSLPAAAAATTPPDVLVRDTTTRLQAEIRANADVYRADRAKLHTLMEELVVPKFDLRYIAQLILAHNWRKATDEQRERFQVAFKDMLIRTYADALVEYNDSVKAEWTPLDLADDQSNVTVESRLLRDNAPPIPIGFAMRKKDGAWKVYDIVIENLSLVTNFRSQVASEIRKLGMDGLIEKLEKGSLAPPTGG